ncbi:MAG: tail fiber domain-containing protein [Pseudomonadales bacterium]|nr:tail fiber domain-containing protein [Pseudomonadales bacterium]
MPFSGGTFSRTFDCTTDRDNGVKILASKFDTELDGFATGLTTTILKDGTQTCTAAIPFAEGLTIPDDKTIVLGTNSDITIQYDESTNDSLEIAANVEGAALGIVLKADQGDDNADQWKLNIADGGTATLNSKISGSFVSQLTLTPNSTAASSTTAVAGNLTVGGDLTLGSGAVITEAELEKLDGITNGTVAADKAVVVDSNKDIGSFRNVTLTGELDAGSLDISGDADIDGTLEADAMTLNGTAITTTATLSTGISNNNVPIFTSGVADDDFLRVAGTSIEGRSASEVLSDIGAQASLTFGISNTNAVKIDSTSVADDEYARFTANGLESRSTSEVLSDIGGMANVVEDTSPALGGDLDLNSNDITGTGNIDNTGTITTDGLTVAGNVSVDGGTIKLDGNYPTGTTNTALGDTALDSVQSGGGLNVAIGQSSLTGVTTGDNNTGVGAYSGITVSTNSNNSYFGAFSGYHQTGATNTALGYASMNGASGQSSGSGNTAAGYNSLTQNTSGSNNVAVGKGALQTATTANNSTCIGQNAGQDVTTAGITAVGQGAGKNITSGSGNTCIGQNAGQSVTTTTESVFIGGRSDGVGAGYSTTGGSNTFIGSGAGSSVTSGTKNTILGRYNGNNGGLDIRTASNYIVLSDGDGNPRQVIDSSGNVGIGTSSPSFTSGNGLHLADNFFAGYGTGASGRPDFQIGTTGGSTLDFRCGTGADTADLSLSTDGVFTGDFNDTSDERLKENIQDIAVNQIDVVKQLRPVTFDWKATEKASNTGFIAQEVAVLLPNDVQRSDPDDSDSTLGINSMALVATLTGALQEAIAKIETLETKVAALEAE